MKLYSHYIKIKNIKINSIRTKSIKIKSIAVLAVCSLFFSVGSGAITSFAHTPDESRFLNGTWEKDDHGWWFANKGNPDYFTSTWAEYQGYSYYFGADGYLVTGWNYINNHWYRFNPEKGNHEGAMMTGWIYDPDYKGWFYTNPSGILVTGWNKIGGEWYYFNPESDGTLGLMAVNQVIDSYYVDSDGKMNEP